MPKLASICQGFEQARVSGAIHSASETALTCFLLMFPAPGRVAHGKMFAMPSLSLFHPFPKQMAYGRWPDALSGGGCFKNKLRVHLCPDFSLELKVCSNAYAKRDRRG